MRVTEPYTIFLRTLPSGRAVYYYQFRDDAGRRSAPRSTGCTKLSQARRYCNQLYNNGQMVTSSVMKFGQFAEHFFDDDSTFCQWKAVNGKPISPSTIRKYRELLKTQIMPFWADYPLNKITTESVKEWIIWLGEHWSPKTGNNAQSVFNIILKGAQEKNLIRSVPSSGLSFRKTQKKERELLTIDEIKTIYHSEKWTTETRREAFLLCCITGMRVGEMACITPADWHDNYVSVTKSWSDRHGVGSTKTRTSRYVPVPYQKQAHRGENWVFPCVDGTHPMNCHGLYKNLVSVARFCKIDTRARGITVHTLRNFFISYLQSEAVPEAKIRAVVGHADETMTDLYTYWKPEMFSEVYTAQKKLYEYIIGD